MKTLFLITVTLLAAVRFAVATEVINVDQKGLALQGYDLFLYAAEAN
jgi:hypothetical protein